MNPKQFLSGLFDLSFQKLVVARRRVVEGVYALCVILVGAGTLWRFIVGLLCAGHAHSLWRVLGTLVAAPLAFLFLVVLLRLAFEALLTLFALAERANCLPEDLQDTPDSFVRK
jgi:hypothetical protein